MSKTMETLVLVVVIMQLFTLTPHVLAAPRKSGCGSASPPQSPGKSTTVTTNFDGDSRKYIIHVPSNYRNDVSTPVVMSFHGWGESASFNERYMGFKSLAERHNYIMIYVEGMSDYQRSSNNGWQSFNAVGSTTTLGGECTSSTTGYCYLSCAKRPQGCGKCDWTSCADDGKFVGNILDSVEENYCIDTERIYASGYSNGGMMAYEVGMALGDRFAAIVPGGGQPFVGHNNAPKKGLMSVMDLHGSNDRTCPANGTTSSDGWNYEPVDNVLKVWATAMGCSDVTSLKKYDTSFDGTQRLYCVSFGRCPSGIDIVRCSYQLGHNWIGYNTDGGTGASLAFEFFLSHSKQKMEEVGVSRASVEQALNKLNHQLYNTSSSSNAFIQSEQ